MPLVEGTVQISSIAGNTAITVVPGPINVVSIGVQGPTGPEGPSGPPAAALTAPAGADLTAIGTVVVLTTDGTLIPADPTNRTHATLLLGMNLTTGNTNAMIKYITVGEITGMSGLSVGQFYFAGANGSLTISSPIASAQWNQPLGNANTEISFILDKQSVTLIN